MTGDDHGGGGPLLPTGNDPDRRDVGKRLVLSFAVGLSAVASCVPLRPPAVPPGALPERILVRTNGRIAAVPLEDYVLGSVLAEITPLNESAATVDRIYEVQAVLARTYAAFNVSRHASEGFDLCDATHCQLYEPARIGTSRFAMAARAAVRRTAGVVLTYEHQPVDALYHADCGGYTASSDSVWGGSAVPYLLAQPDDMPTLTHRVWEVTVPIDRLRLTLDADPRSQVGGHLDDLEVLERDVGGRAIRIGIFGDRSPIIRGEELRAIVNQSLGAGAILSTRFSIMRTGDAFVFRGSGFGHGVGLCQVGALARARRGESLDAILGAYFRGVGLARLPNAVWPAW